MLESLIYQKYMPNCKLHFIKPGMLTLVQDEGRIGYQKYGVPVSGALDKTAMQIANWLVGNPINNPVLEITMMGPQIQISGNAHIAITGADMSPTINGGFAPLYESVEVKQDDIISFGKLNNGCRSYLAVGGKWQIEPWLGSCSAIVFNGKELVTGGRIQKKSEINIISKLPIKKRKLDDFSFADNIVIRVLSGPEFECFSRAFIGNFFSKTFKVSPDSNRMGYRLEKSISGFLPEREIISSGIVPGTIQITHSGQPILLLSDAQTTGGYHRIANVILADMDRLAQLKPGDEIRFSLINLKEAYLALENKNTKHSFLNE